MNIIWGFKPFKELSNSELYAIMKFRQEVFVVEQNCAYMDCDEKDLHSYHLVGLQSEKLVAYARILPAGVSYKEVSIGRIATAKNVRHQGIGKLLMQTAMSRVEELYGKVPMRIGAQTYLVDFYSCFGFVPESAYMEDGIPHTHMFRKQ